MTRDGEAPGIDTAGIDAARLTLMLNDRKRCCAALLPC